MSSWVGLCFHGGRQSDPSVFSVKWEPRLEEKEKVGRSHPGPCCSEWGVQTSGTGTTWGRVRRAGSSASPRSPGGPQTNESLPSRRKGGKQLAGIAGVVGQQRVPVQDREPGDRLAARCGALMQSWLAPCRQEQGQQRWAREWGFRTAAPVTLCGAHTGREGCWWLKGLMGSGPVAVDDGTVDRWPQ